MTTLTSNGLILEAPIENVSHYLLVWQLKNYDSYLTHPKNKDDSLAWLTCLVEETE